MTTTNLQGPEAPEKLLVGWLISGQALGADRRGLGGEEAENRLVIAHRAGQTAGWLQDKHIGEGMDGQSEKVSRGKAHQPGQLVEMRSSNGEESGRKSRRLPDRAPGGDFPAIMKLKELAELAK